MKRLIIALILALVLIAQTIPALAFSCSTHTYSMGGRFVTCQTCCGPLGCQTTCF